MAHTNTTWVGINIQWDGTNISVKYSDMTVRELTNLFHGALKEIPWCKDAMELAIELTKPSEMDRTVFNYNLRLLRCSRGLNTIQLSDVLEFDYTRIRIIENNPNVLVQPEEIQRIAQYFNVDAEALTSVKAIVSLNANTNGKKNQ
jgi:hypothetical protein